MAIEVPRTKIFLGEKEWREKGVASAIRRRRATWGRINTKERKRERVV